MKPTPQQLAMLKNVAAGVSATYGLSGRSAMGGASSTWAALHRHGLLSKGLLTDAGRAAIESAAVK